MNHFVQQRIVIDNLLCQMMFASFAKMVENLWSVIGNNISNEESGEEGLGAGKFTTPTVWPMK